MPDKTHETPKDIVKGIFERPKKGEERVSPIFTHRKDTPKIISPPKRKPEIPPDIKPLPAAIDIGTSSVKVIRMGENQRKQLEIICVDREPSSPSVKQALKNIKGRNELGNLCVSNLPAKDTQIYNMIFPPMSEEELKSAIQYKVSQLKPFGLGSENIVYRWKTWNIAEGIPMTSQQRVVIACVPRDVIEKHISILEDSGFKPVSAEIPQFSLVNLGMVYRPSEHKDKITLWVHIGAEESFLAIERGGVACFARKIALTSNQMTESISRHCRISIEEAESLKKKEGFPESAGKETEKPEPVYYALMSLLENLVVDIEHSFKYFSYQAAQSQITRFNRVILSGGGANLKNLDKFLNVRLGVPVEHFNPFSVFKVMESIKTERSELINEPATFAVSTALSLGQKMEEPGRVNFLPEKEKGVFKALGEALKQGPVKIAVAAVVAITLLVGSQVGKVGFYKTKMTLLMKKVQKAKFQISRLETRKVKLAKEEGDLTLKKDMLEAQLNLLEGGLRGRTDISEALRSVASLLPEEIWVNELKYKDGKLTITGSTVDTILIIELVENIKDSDDFVNAAFSYTQKDPDKEIYTFEIITDIKT